jgi:Fuc2NAc and GlcNAc transferase
MAIAVVSLGGIGAGAAAGVVPGPVAAAALGGGILVAGVGWADDHGGLSARMRAAAHLAAAVWALWWLGGLTELSMGTATLTLGPAGNVLAALGIVWCINLYNFMDGIDGIAAGEALTAGLAGAVLLLLAGDGGLAAVAL